MALLEDDRPRVAVDHKVAVIVGHGVVRHAVEGLHVLEGEDIRDALWVVLDPSIPPEVSDCVD